MVDLSNEEKSYLLDHCLHKLMFYKYNLDLSSLSENGKEFADYRCSLLSSIIQKLKA